MSDYIQQQRAVDLRCHCGVGLLARLWVDEDYPDVPRTSARWPGWSWEPMRGCGHDVPLPDDADTERLLARFRRTGPFRRQIRRPA